MQTTIALIGGGNLGTALAEGFLRVPSFDPGRLTVTRRHVERLAPLALRGVCTGADNAAAVRSADLVVVAVEPAQVPGVLIEITPELEPGRHVLVSCAAGVDLDALGRLVPDGVPLFRAMPNTASSVGASMTCIVQRGDGAAARETVREVFELVGRVEFLDEELMGAATALAACGIAYSMRFVRAASQGGTEIGFDAETARRIAAQTVLGAARLLAENGLHPEREIDRVTTPRGCTIAGLNEMEHRGFSSALIKGITTSFAKIDAVTRVEG